jgi:hypothetical protein
MAGKAATVMFVFSSLSRVVPPPGSAGGASGGQHRDRDGRRYEHVAGFHSLLHQTLRITRPATSWVGIATGRGDYCVTMIIIVRIVRHTPNGTTCPNLTSFC